VDKSKVTAAGAAIDDVRVSDEPDWHAASLRYFTVAGDFAREVHGALGQGLPRPLRAGQILGGRDAQFLLAWRSPTETVLLCDDRQAFVDLKQRLEKVADGCMVEQTGGIRVLRIQGPKAKELMRRLGSASAIPEPGEARSGRLAELQVLTVGIQSGEFLLLVERAYKDHLLEWIAATVADFAAV
jgi:sarcosine oxidase gamma subunit